MDASDIGRIFERQRAHAATMARTGVAERRERLGRLRRAIRERRSEITHALHRDLRRPAAESEIAEVHHCLQEIDHAIRHLARWMRPRRVRTPVLLFGTSSRLMHEPRGVVLILAAWNYPFGLAVNPLVAAIAAGNCAVVKPSEKAPATADMLAALLGRVFDPSECAVVQGGPETAGSLLELPFDHFFFTGGTKTGRRVMEAAAGHLATVTLELGGKSPAVVDASADLNAAATRTAWGKFFNAGQSCVAPDYALVQESVVPQFVSRLTDAVSRFYGASDAARRATPDFARIIDDVQFARLVGLIEAARAAGAHVATGAESDAATRYIAPTVLSGVSVDSPIMTEEIFGPILPVLAYREPDEAIEIIRRHGHPLASYVFSRDRRFIEHVMRGFSAGATMVNHTLLHYGSSQLPFGGVGSSGMGRYHGHHGFLAFSNVRSVVTQWGPAFTRALFPPYRGRVHSLALRALRWLE